MTKEYTPCPTCGGNPNLQRSCCTHEKLRRARKRRDSTKCATPTASGICENCGGNTTIARICCDVERRRRNALYTASNRQKQIIKEKNRIKQIAEKGPHVCCDCGTPTPDRRCDKCRAKWNAKHGVSSSSHSLSADWQGF